MHRSRPRCIGLKFVNLLPPSSQMLMKFPRVIRHGLAKILCAIGASVSFAESSFRTAPASRHECLLAVCQSPSASKLTSVQKRHEFAFSDGSLHQSCHKQRCQGTGCFRGSCFLRVHACAFHNGSTPQTNIKSHTGIWNQLCLRKHPLLLQFQKIITCQSGPIS